MKISDLSNYLLADPRIQNYTSIITALSRRQIDNIFLFFFPQKIGFDISCNLSLICMKSQRLFSGKKKKKKIKMLSSQILPNEVSIKYPLSDC